MNTYLCFLTKRVIENPRKLKCGHIFEAWAVNYWLLHNSKDCPQCSEDEPAATSGDKKSFPCEKNKKDKSETKTKNKEEYVEKRSDESDNAGSLVDFVVNNDSDGNEDFVDKPRPRTCKNKKRKSRKKSRKYRRKKRRMIRQSEEDIVELLREANNFIDHGMFS